MLDMDYLKWNNLIAKHFFNESNSGREVLLYVNEELIKELGVRFSADVNDFIESVKNGPDWVTRLGFCQRALQVFEGWRKKKIEYPPYISYLAFFVLAAGTESDFATHAYYPRVWKLLGEPEDSGTLPSFDKMIKLWDDLEKWSREDKHEELGRFVARIRGELWKVGLPLSQTLISEDERKHLTNLFDRAGLDPTDTPSPAAIIKAFIVLINQILIASNNYKFSMANFIAPRTGSVTSEIILIFGYSFIKILTITFLKYFSHLNKPPTRTRSNVLSLKPSFRATALTEMAASSASSASILILTLSPNSAVWHTVLAR